MDFADILGPNQIIPELRATDRWEAIDELIGILVATGKIKEADRELIKMAVKKREQFMSTGVGFGIAIPHADTDLAETLVMALGRAKNGIDFDSLDKQPVNLIFLVLVPARLKPRYFKTLAGFAQQLRQVHFCDKLREAPGAASIFDVLNGGFTLVYFPSPFLDLAELLSPQQIILEMQSTNCWQAIDELIDRLVAVGQIEAAHRDAIADSVKKREKHNGTRFDFIAVPRCFCALVPKPICVFGISKKGIQFKGGSLLSTKGRDETAKWVMLVLRPSDGRFDRLASDIQFNLLKAGSKSKQMREALEKCTNTNSAYDILCQQVRDF